MLVLDMIDIHPPLGKYKYDTWRILPVKCYVDNSVRLHIWLDGDIRPRVRYVRPGLTIMVLEPDLDSDKFDTSDMSKMGSDISDWAAVPQFWNPMEIYDLIRYLIR
jgi:hypothetical protein